MLVPTIDNSEYDPFCMIIKIQFLKKREKGSERELTPLLAASHMPCVGVERQSSVSVPWADKQCCFYQKWQWGSVLYSEAAIWDCWGFMMSGVKRSDSANKDPWAPLSQLGMQWSFNYRTMSEIAINADQIMSCRWRSTAWLAQIEI